MCIAPTKVYPQLQAVFSPVDAACGKCWACLKNKVNVLVGKCLMEWHLAEWSYALTLTYDDEKLVDRPTSAGRNAAKIVYKADFQNFIRALKVAQQRAHEKAKRNDVPQIRYLVAGEFGELKGRVHFHVILMGSGIPPEIPPLRQKCQHMKYWRWGFVFSDVVASDRTVRYVAKYLVKEQSDKNKNRDKPKGVEHAWLSYSKQPPLGEYGFRFLGLQQAQARIMPRDMRYKPPLVTRPKDRFSMTYAQERVFWEEMENHWPESMSLSCTEWVHNSRLRYKKFKQLKKWESLVSSEKLQIIFDEMRPKKVDLHVEPVPDEYKSDDYDIRFLKWREAVVDAILQNEFLSLDQRHQEASWLRASLGRRKPSEIVGVLETLSTRLRHSLSSAQGGDITPRRLPNDWRPLN